MERQNRRVKQELGRPSSFEPQDDEEREIEGMFRDGTIARAIEKARRKGTSSVTVKVDAKPVKVPVTMRLDALTVAVLKDRARSEGLRYQSLVNSVLHKFVTGKLVERK